MRHRNEVLQQMENFQEKIDLLNNLRNSELKKKHSVRDYNLLKWTFIELSIYNHTLNRFKWVLDINQDTHEEEE